MEQAEGGMVDPKNYIYILNQHQKPSPDSQIVTIDDWLLVY